MQTPHCKTCYTTASNCGTCAEGYGLKKTATGTTSAGKATFKTSCVKCADKGCATCLVVAKTGQADDTKNCST